MSGPAGEVHLVVTAVHSAVARVPVVLLEAAAVQLLRTVKIIWTLISIQ